MKKQWAVCAGFIFLAGGVVWGETEDLPRVVGGLAAKEALVFAGNDTFSKEEICRSLYTEPKVIVAMSPGAPFRQYLDFLREVVERGYRNNGFFRPEVSVTFDGQQQKIRVNIVEGPRYREGKILITGIGEALAEDLAGLLKDWKQRVKKAPTFILGQQPAVDEKLVEKFLEGEFLYPFSWNETEWVCFDEGFAEPSKQYVDSLLNVLGVYHARFDLKVVPNPDNHTADLCLDFGSEGVQARIGNLDITGNKAHSAEQVATYLGLEKGQPINSIRIAQINSRLRESGRFRRCTVAKTIDEKRPDQSTLKLILEENPGVSPLNAPLSESEELMLRVGKFLNDYSNWQEDVRLEGSIDQVIHARFEGVVSPQRGVILTETGSEAGNTLGIRKEEFLYACPALGHFALASDPTLKVVMQFQIAPDKKDGWIVNAGLGFAGGSRKPERTGLAYDIQMEVPPAYWIHVAHQKEYSIRSKDQDLVRISRQGPETSMDLIFNRSTGKIVEFKITFSLGSVWCRFEKGALEERFEDLRTRMAATGVEPVQTRSSRVILSSVLPIYLSHSNPSISLDQKRAALKVWNHIFFHDIGGCIPDTPASAMDKERFPLPHYDLAGSDENMTRYLAGVVFSLCHENLPQDHWLWILSHITVLIATGHGECDSVTKEIQGLYASDQIGPVGYYLISRVFQKMGHLAYRSFLERSWQSLPAERFGADWIPLVEGKSRLAEIVRCSLGRLGDLGPNEIRSAEAILLPEAAEGFKAGIQWLKDHPNPEWRPSLEPLLMGIWNQTLRAKLQEQLAEMDPTLTVRYLSPSILQEPNNPVLYNLRGTSYAMLEQYNPAGSDFNRAIELDPKFAMAYANRSQVYLNLNQHDLALADCTKAIEIDPTIAHAYNNRGICLTRNQEYDKAIADFTKAIELDSKKAEYFLNRGLAHYRSKRIRESIEDCTQAIELSSNKGALYALRGTTWLELNEYQKALDDYLKARDLNYRVDEKMIQELRNKLKPAGTESVLE
ncbi:MAG: tetratricopeptide repeat protein [Phycisphaerae bacterium]|nr:tetratricopeptide repeat protein [Phycisphaerae bacterium]